jgi:hypothetical protein
MAGIFILVVFALGIYALISNGTQTYEGWGFAAFTMVITWLIGTGASIAVMMSLSEIWVEDTPVQSRLVSLADGSSTHGSFFLGSGSVDSEPVFFFYRESDDGSYRLEHRDAEYVSIVETSGVPHMETLCVDYSHLPRWFDWPLPRSEAPNYSDCRDNDPTTFYVPEGSIKSNYILDAQ